MKKTIVLIASGLLLASCGQPSNTSSSDASSDDYKMKWISPTGNVAVAFYDQGSNESWDTALADLIRPQLLANQYDAILFDGVAGLTVLSSNPNSNYVFADWVSEGTFYVVSTKHTANDDFEGGSLIDAFVQGGNASKAFRSLAENWGWDLEGASVTYEAGAPNVLANLIGADAYDYYVLAEPAITTAKAKLTAQGKTLNVVYNLQEEWAKFHDGAKIPAGGLFVNKNTVADHKSVVDSFLANVHTRLDTAIDEPKKVEDALNEYEALNPDSDTDAAERFGLTGALVYNLQTAGNKLGLIKSGAIEDNKGVADSFSLLTGGNEFSENLFLK